MLVLVKLEACIFIYKTIFYTHVQKSEMNVYSYPVLTLVCIECMYHKSLSNDLVHVLIVNAKLKILMWLSLINISGKKCTIQKHTLHFVFHCKTVRSAANLQHRTKT